MLSAGFMKVIGIAILILTFAEYISSLVRSGLEISVSFNCSMCVHYHTPPASRII